MVPEVVVHKQNDIVLVGVQGAVSHVRNLEILHDRAGLKAKVAEVRDLVLWLVRADAGRRGRRGSPGDDHVGIHEDKGMPHSHPTQPSSDLHAVHDVSPRDSPRKWASFWYSRSSSSGLLR